MAKNAFAGLVIEDDDEPTPIVVKKAAKPAAAPAAAPVAAPAAAPQKKFNGDRAKSAPVDGARPARRPRPSGDNANGNEPAERTRAPRQPRDNQEKTTERQYKNERQSHDGRGNARAPKREGRGKGNWGTAEDELKAPVSRQESTVEVKPEEGAPAAEGAEATTPAETPAAEVAPAEPEGPKTFTLDQFKRQRAQEAAKLAAKPKRQANEGVDLSQWAGAEVIKRDEDKPQAASDDHKPASQQRSALKQHVDIAINFGRNEPRPERSERSERPERKQGDFKGGKPQGNRGPRPAGGSRPRGNGPLNVASEADFPKL